MVIKDLNDEKDIIFKVESVKQEIESIKEASQHVEDNGYLIYCIPTFCKNEGRNLPQRSVVCRDERKRFVPIWRFSSLIRKNSKTFFGILGIEPVTHDIVPSKVVSYEEICLCYGRRCRPVFLPETNV